MKFKVLLIYPNTMMATLLPMSISSLSAYLKEKDIEVELFDTTFYHTEEINFEKKKEWLLQVKPFDMNIDFKKSDMYEDLKKMVNDYKPDLIGLSVVEDTIDQGLSLLNYIEDYHCPVVVGGACAIFCFERIMQNKNVDIICFGEGERPLFELCYALKNREDYSRINNLLCKIDSVDGFTATFNPMRNPINIDVLPTPDFSIFEEKRRSRVMHGKTYSMLHYEFDRGCPFNCTYCTSPAINKIYNQKYYRRKNSKKIIRDLVYLKNQYSFDYLDINSETFLLRNENTLKQLMLDYREYVELPFWCQSRLHTITDEKIRILKESGISDMQFGIEHGNEKFRKQWLKRKESNKQMLGGLEIVEKYNIPYTVNNIIGFPDETRELIFDTINFNKQINPKTMNCYMMAPYKGSWIRRYCEEQGLLKKDSKTMQLLDGADIKYRYMTKKQFLGLQRCFPLYVKYDEAHDIKKAEDFTEEGNLVFQEYRQKYINDFYS